MVIDQNIYWIDKSISRKRYGPYVRVSVGRKETNKRFPVLEYGSRKLALAAARDFIHQVTGGVNGDLRHSKKSTARRYTTNVVGVTRSVSYTRSKKAMQLRYQVSMVIDGKQHSVCLYCGTVDIVTEKRLTFSKDIEDKAFRVAVLIRNTYNDLKDAKAEFTIADLKYKNWKRRDFDNIVTDMQILLKERMPTC